MVQNHVCSLANATEGICLVLGCVNHLASVVVWNPWKDNECQEECVCQPNSGTVVCARSHWDFCRESSAATGIVLGCAVQGITRYTTFDGRRKDITGNCTYLLTSHQNAAHQPWPWNGLQCVTWPVMSHIWFMTCDGYHFDFNMGRCVKSCILFPQWLSTWSSCATGSTESKWQLGASLWVK